MWMHSINRAASSESPVTSLTSIVLWAEAFDRVFKMNVRSLSLVAVQNKKAPACICRHHLARTRRSLGMFRGACTFHQPHVHFSHILHPIESSKHTALH
jgi:hypothetical protein